MLRIRRRRKHNRIIKYIRRNRKALCCWAVLIVVSGVISWCVVGIIHSWTGLVHSEQKCNLIQNSTGQRIEETGRKQKTLEYESSERLSGKGKEFDEIILVNKENELSSDYEVSLTTLKNGQQVASVMYEDLREMLFTGEEEAGISFLVASGYRPAEKQEKLLQEEITKNMNCGMNYDAAYEDAILTVAPAGYSEHETGLAVDIVAVSNQRLDDTQEFTRENQWLQENCYQYGFILRYPKDKEDITGFSYESWHFRYVGKEAAKKITEEGITLEEYLE